MTEQPVKSTTPTLFSIIIAAYNDWVPLDHTLRSLAQQESQPSFEVIVGDDGSTEPAPEFIHKWSQSYPLTILRLSHEGISAARNQGVQASKGKILLFVDADCRLEKNCLAALAATIAALPQHNYFQLHLVGDCLGTVGKAEELRLAMLQQHMLQPDGRIRYLNTAGFAMRKASVDIARGVFDPVALRAEDTFLMATLMQRGELPYFVANAIVEHAIPLSVLECLRKDIRSIYLEAQTYDLIASKGVRFRVGYRERLAMVCAMWTASAKRSFGRRPWFLVTGRQGLRLVASYVYRCARLVRLIP
jgi:glycosyltransferase involved in cell wall biosynthesis